MLAARPNVQPTCSACASRVVEREDGGRDRGDRRREEDADARHDDGRARRSRHEAPRVCREGAPERRVRGAEVEAHLAAMHGTRVVVHEDCAGRRQERRGGGGGIDAHVTSPAACDSRLAARERPMSTSVASTSVSRHDCKRVQAYKGLQTRAAARHKPTWRTSAVALSRTSRSSLLSPRSGDSPPAAASEGGAGAAPVGSGTRRSVSLPPPAGSR